MARDLSNKVIVITGASSGIGAATALASARAGMDVVVSARRVERLRQVADDIERIGGRALVVSCDVRRDDDVERLIDEPCQTFGRLDAVFTNAGYALIDRVLETPDEQARDLFETNYFGMIRCLKAAMPKLRQVPDGLKHLLICSSSVSEVGIPFYGVYCATKAAQDSIAGALRAELAGEGIEVTSIHPVGTRTDLFATAAAHSNRPAPEGVPNTPKSMVQSPEEVAEAIVKALKKPRPEVWPRPAVRFGLAVLTAFPSIAARSMRSQVSDDSMLKHTTDG